MEIGDVCLLDCSAVCLSACPIIGVIITLGSSTNWGLSVAGHNFDVFCVVEGSVL